MASSEKPFPISPALTRILDAIRLAGLPVLLVGSHGIGKSQFLEGYAHSRGLVPHVLDLSLLEATDLTGIPYIEAGKTRFAPPITLPDSQASAPAMLVLEELNRCDRSVRQPCLQLLTARRLNDYRLPANCFLAACINPADKDYQVDALDPALASRFVSLKVRPDRDAWLNWARDHDVHPGVVRFIAKFSQAFDRAPPRTWTHAARLLSTALQQGWQIKEVESLLQPLLGAMTARALIVDLPDEMPSIPPRLLLERPRDYIRSFETWMRQERLDVVGVVLEQLHQHLRHHTVERSTLDMKSLHRIFDVTPPDLSLPLLELLEAS